MLTILTTLLRIGKGGTYGFPPKPGRELADKYGGRLAR
jgi:hypothetical protein